MEDSMKGVSGNPALDAYQRMAVSPVTGARRAAPVATGAEAPPAEAAKVSISSEARTRASAGEGQVDMQKVEMLKAKLAEGSYQVDTKLVASRLLDHIA
jgi:negative regulator of flagellin synthesis FlgM